MQNLNKSSLQQYSVSVVVYTWYIAYSLAIELQNRINFYQKENFINYFENFRASLNIQNGHTLHNGFQISERLSLPYFLSDL